MKILLVSALNHMGWFQPNNQYYGFGALGDVFEGDVFYMPFKPRTNVEIELAKFDVCFLQQTKDPFLHWIKTFRELKKARADLPIVLLQEGGWQLTYMYPPEERKVFFDALSKVDAFYHHGDLGGEFKDNLPEKHKTFVTPFPIKKIQSTIGHIPKEDRHEILIVGSTHWWYNGMFNYIAARHFQKSNPDLQLVGTMIDRQIKGDPKLYDRVIPELPWWRWLNAIKTCRYYSFHPTVFGSGSFFLACWALDIMNVRGGLSASPMANYSLDKFEFETCKTRIMEDMLNWGVIQ